VALRYAQQEGKRRGGHTLWELVAGGGPGEVVADGAAARPVVAGRKGVPRERETGGREREREGNTGEGTETRRRENG
jgi:hypothetical protein